MSTNKPPAKNGSKISALWRNWKGQKANKKKNDGGSLVKFVNEFVNENAAHPSRSSNFYALDALPSLNLHNAIILNHHREPPSGVQRRPPRDPNNESYFNGERSKVIVKNSISLSGENAGYMKAALTKNYRPSPPTHLPPLTHSTDDCIMPDLYRIIQLNFFWQDLDRFKAEELLNDKPEGSFLLRISSHEHYLFSVSFRSHNRSLHARIEKEKKLYSFDLKDAESQKFSSVCDLFENYRDTKRYIFEPILTHPLNNPHRHTLKQLAQYRIISLCNYHHIDQLPLPKILKDKLKSFNYCSDNLR